MADQRPDCRKCFPPSPSNVEFLTAGCVYHLIYSEIAATTRSVRLWRSIVPGCVDGTSSIVFVVIIKINKNQRITWIQEEIRNDSHHLDPITNLQLNSTPYSSSQALTTESSSNPRSPHHVLPHSSPGHLVLPRRTSSRVRSFLFPDREPYREFLL